ncbi:MAG: DUF6580 family putative transport protein [Ignavibacteriaceae bacterium]
MNSFKLSPRFLLLTGMILIAAIVRLLPHPPNFAPIAAMALFGGAYFNRKVFAFAIPLAALFLTDLFLGFHNTMWAVYLSFVVIVGLGMVILKKKSVVKIILASVSASVLFFILTNFAFWATDTLYPTTLTGLAACYTAAIPFFHNTVIGDLFFTGAMFGLFELAKVKFPQLVRVKS